MQKSCYKTLVFTIIIALLGCDQNPESEAPETSIEINGEEFEEIASVAAPKTSSPKKKPSKGALVIQNLSISEFKEIEWTDLMPKEDLDAILNPPEYLNDIEDGGEGDVVTGQLGGGETVQQTMAQTPEEKRYQEALVSKKIRPEFDGRHIRIPGFIVPLEFDDEQTITTFFLVPYFGACIHEPPPPPNQILYAEYEPGFKLSAIYDPFWIRGTISTTLVENDLATAAYSLTVRDIEPYGDD